MPIETTRDHSRIVPPARQVLLAQVTDQPIDLQALASRVEGASSGAVVTFGGVVRNHDGGREVTGLEYVGHPTAQAVLERVVAEVTAASDAEAVAVSHRIGTLAIGDTALAVAVAGAHRQEAFETAMRLVDEVKAQLPIWKRQVLADGTDEWVACP
ncbi:molybdenum cofactor biosynthesis protein MoaE [Kineosporia sp. NBRC 101731]|uniref:molybdenum cofactor biosynthesis protein MoaE n=1 Tax=Kineosporia sp. NBRC 101731 TaxID=3032199 RepID=UPI0024A58677|nr:molybdenum cofactor biosynthesis protein MoaE [Kineosporia sp. NBRC 101731]GLY31178.1 molybdenum cofactor biosynthesis protein MoaE [Kineosporia sp. NBRC 101731]